MESGEDRILPPSIVKINFIKKEEEPISASNLVKLENVMKIEPEYVEYDIKKEPKHEFDETTLNVDILKREEEEDAITYTNNNNDVVLGSTQPLKTGPMCLDLGRLSTGQIMTGSIIGVKRKFLYQQLLFLLHARKCCKKEPNQCSIPGCMTYKDLLDHTSTCQAGNKCKVLNCSISRLILSHFDNCSKPSCALCLPLRSQSSGDNSSLNLASSGSNPQVIPDDVTVTPLHDKQHKAEDILQLPGVHGPITLQANTPNDLAQFEALKKTIKSVETLRAKEVNLNLREERLRIREQVLEVRTKELNKQKLDLDKQEFDLTVAQVDLWYRESLVKEKEETMMYNGNLRVQRDKPIDASDIVARRISSNLKQAVKDAPKDHNLQTKRKIQSCELPRKRTSTNCLVNITNGTCYPLKPSSKDPFLPQFE